MDMVNNGRRQPIKRVYILVLSLIVLTNLKTSAQMIDIKSLPKAGIEKHLQAILAEKGLTPDLIVKHIKDINDYPTLSEYKGQHIFSMSDSVYGTVPFKLYLPLNYDPSLPVPLILSLHGAVGLSKFSDAAKPDQQLDKDDDPFYRMLCEKGFVVIKPYADPEKGFNWVADKFGQNENFTFNVLTRLISELKRSINIDDNKVFSFGHSDGSDGTFALEVYKPTMFAGFIAYNSMLTNIFSNKIYLENTVNRPLYLVHSDKDDLRPIEQTRAIVKLLDSLKTNVTYKEYLGYTHEDSHLQKDFANSLKFIAQTKRNPYPDTIYWETSSNLFKQCDWLMIKDWDSNLDPAVWHKSYNLPSYNKRTKSWDARNYYQLDLSTAVKANYRNNIFTISTSRATKLEILISPQMVDFSKDVKVIVNNKTIYSSKVVADKSFIITQFSKDVDRKAIWLTSIIADVNL